MTGFPGAMFSGPVFSVFVQAASWAHMHLKYM